VTIRRAQGHLKRDDAKSAKFLFFKACVFFAFFAPLRFNILLLQPRGT
jgi:hypothetical protein